MPGFVPYLQCHVEPDGACVLVRPVGEIDLGSAQVVEDALRAAKGRGADHVLLDLARVTFMDSTGIHLLVRWTAAAQRDGFAFRVAPGDGPVRRVLELTGVLDALPVTEPIA